MGDEIKFTRDKSITAIILDCNKNIVSFRDKKMKFNDATLIALKELGYEWSSFQPARQWTIDNENNLHHMRVNLEAK